MTDIMMSVLLVVTIFKMVSWVIPVECFVAFVAAGLLFSAIGLYVKDNYVLFADKVQSSAPAAKRTASGTETWKKTFKVPYRYNIVGPPAAGSVGRRPSGGRV